MRLPSCLHLFLEPGDLFRRPACLDASFIALPSRSANRADKRPSKRNERVAREAGHHYERDLSADGQFCCGKANGSWRSDCHGCRDPSE
jgi:hypothetical protein